MRDAFTIVVDPAYTQANGSSIALQSTLKLTRAFLVAPLYLWRAQMALTKCLLFLLATGSSLQFQTRVGGKRSSIRSRHFNVAQSALAESIDFKEARNEKSTGRVSILVCPAQFCVPDDYLPLFDNLKALESKGGLTTSIGSFRVAPLPRTEWIKVARQLPTKAFLDGCLPVAKTLGWYFDAMDRAVAEIVAEEGSSARICIIGHSIGGWVARAYLGGLAQSSTAVHRIAVEQVSSLVTLGTPHISTEDALVDQTRGLLRAIAEAPSCEAQALVDRGIDITCVGSDALGGKLLTTNVEELVAVASYLPLLGRLGGLGDGIVPVDLAFMASPARRVIVNTCQISKQPVRHAHILPIPWNLWDGYAPSIKLSEETYPSYTSPGVLSQWAQFIR
jgi:hypothetical protein